MKPFLSIASMLLLAVFASAQDTSADEKKYEEVLAKLRDTMDEMTKVLKDVKDEETAKANTSKLRVQAIAFIATRKQSELLAPPSAEVRDRLALKWKGDFEKARKELVAEIARVQRVEGGNLPLQELRGVFDKVEKK